MKKLNKLFAIIIAVLGVTTLKAQTDVTNTYLKNPSFEYSAEGTKYSVDTKELGNGEAIYGWTGATISNNTKNIQVTKTAPNTAFGKTSASDGEYYYFIRQGWEDKTSSITQSVNLPEGRYYLSVDYKQAESHDNNSFRDSKVGLTITKGGTSLSTLSTGGSVNAPGGSYFTNIDWKQIGTWFDVEEAGDVTIALTFALNGTSRRADLCLDNVKLYQWDLEDQTNYDNAARTNPMDVTAKFVTNPYFDANTNGWISTTGAQNRTRAVNQAGAISGGFFENWNPSSIASGKIYQTLSGLINGIYRVTISAYGTQGTPKLKVYAGGSSVDVTSETPLNYSVETTVSGNGSLEIGLEVQSGNGSKWIGIDNVKLEYLGYDLTAANEQLTQMISEAQNIVSANEAAPKAIENLTNAITAAQSVEQNKNAIQTASTNLATAIDDAKATVVPYAKAITLFTICESILTNSAEFVDNAKATFSSVVNTAKTGVEAATTADAINTIYNTLESARRTYVQQADPTNDTYFDYTFLMTNPAVANGDGWTGARTNSGQQYTGAPDNTYWDSWNGAGQNIYQELTGLPSGLYTLKAAGRASESCTSAYIYLNDTKAEIDKAGSSGNDLGNGWKWYTTEKTAVAGTAKVGFGCNTASSQWAGADDFHLYYYGFDVETAKNGVTTLKAEAETLVGKPMNKGVASALNEAIKGADANKTTRNELNSMIDELNTAIASAKASVAEYEKIAGYIAKANKIDESIAAEVQTLYNSSTLGEAEPVFQALEVATYKYVTENFNYAVSLSSTWNSTGTNTSAADVKGEHWSDDKEYTYKNQFDGWGDPKQGYPANSWTIDFDQEVTLPAGEYVFKVAGRKSVDATLELVVTKGGIELGTVNDFPNSNAGLGINKAGAASFDANDPAGFAIKYKDNGEVERTGYGWQWRYVRFVLDEEATVKVAVHAETNKIYNWVSFGDYTLQMTEETYLEANKGGLDAPTAAANALVDTKPMGAAENTALKAALEMPVNTGEELQAKIDSLNTAVANAKAWVPLYNEKKAPLVAALERFEADYNDATGCLYKLQNTAWANVIEMVKAAAIAKDVTDSYEGFAAAAENLNSALDAAQASINMYANLAAEISYAKAYTPIVEGNVAVHNDAITDAENAYTDAEIDDASELIRAMQNFRVIDYEYVSNYYNLDQPVELNGEWTGDKNTTNGQHWKGDNTSYYDYNQSNEEPYEATITVTLQPGEYVLMAAGRAQTTGSSAYIKVTDKLAYFAAKGNTGYGIDTDGKANFSSEATYANDNKGRGWEYRFIEFTLTEETEVTLVAGMQIGSNSWASVCTPVLYTTPLNAAKNDLQTAIDEAEKALNAYPVGEEAFQVSENSELYVALKSAIATAQNVLDNAATAEELNNAIDPLNTAVSNYNDGYVLNAPKEGVKYQIAISYAGYRYDGSAFAPNADPTKGIAVPVKNNSSNVNYWNDFTFTPVNDIRNGYTISITSVDGTTYYLCTGKQENGSDENQIRMTTNPEKALTLVVKATTTDGIYNLLNTRANNATIGCQDDRNTDGGLYTTNAHNTITITEAVKAEVTLKISSVGWATLILPFNAKLPEGVVAYESNGVEDGAVQLVKAGSLVANTPYLIKGAEGTYNFSDYGLATEDSYTKNLFVGTYVEIKAEVGSYVLQNPKDDEGNPRGLGFYLVGEGKQPTVGAYRSYMQYTPAEGQAASPMFRIGGSTGIDNTTLPNSNEVVIYDLMGRKVTTMEKGNMYIINGRKVIVK